MGMKNLKIALLQIAPGGSLEENLEKGLASCRKAREMGADIALFPEMWSSGYRIYNRPVSEWQAEAVSADSDFVRRFGQLAGELSMAIGVTLLEKVEGDPRNTLILFDRQGNRKTASDARGGFLCDDAGHCLRAGGGGGHDLL